MKPSTKQIKDILWNENVEFQQIQKDFIMKNVPRLHRLLMEKFPKLVEWFDYGICIEPKDPSKLTLVRGKKVIARNY